MRGPRSGLVTGPGQQLDLGLSRPALVGRLDMLPKQTRTPNRSQIATSYPMPDAELVPLEPIQSCILVLAIA